MMIENLLLVLLLALVASLAVSVYAIIMVARLKSQFKKTSLVETDKIAGLQNDIRALTAGAVGVGKKLFSLERDSRRIQERQNQAEVYKDDGRPYDQAIRMARNGTSVDELMSICELSRNEAELLIMMHRLGKAS